MKLKEATYFPDAEELTRFGFERDVLDFIQQLIGVNPLKARLSNRLKRFGFDEPKMITILTTPETEGVPESAVIIRTEKIKSGGIDENGETQKDEFQVSYKVPKKDLQRGIKGVIEKLRNIYIKLFESHIVEGTVLNEDGEGGECFVADGAAACNNSAPVMPAFYDKSGKEEIITKKLFTWPNKKEKSKNESKKMKRPIGRLTMFITEEQMEQLAKLLKEEAEMGTRFGDFGYDAPPFSDDETMDHDDMLDFTKKKNKAVGHKSLNEWVSVGDADVKDAEETPEDEWKHFARIVYDALEWDDNLKRHINKSYAISGYIRKKNKGWSGRLAKDVRIERNERDSVGYIKQIVYRLDVAKIIEGDRLEIVGLEHGSKKEVFFRFQWEPDRLPDQLKEGGSGIHIKKKNKGKFTATKKRTGKSTSELLHSPNKKTRARANFARMAKRGWKPLKDE